MMAELYENTCGLSFQTCWAASWLARNRGLLRERLLLPAFYPVGHRRLWLATTVDHEASA